MDLNNILNKHEAWLNEEPYGERAILEVANLEDVDANEADIGWYNPEV